MNTLTQIESMAKELLDTAVTLTAKERRLKQLGASDVTINKLFDARVKVYRVAKDLYEFVESETNAEEKER